MDAPRKIGRYEILEELGHGAMGTVYRALDPSMERIVALKTIISLALASQQGSEYRERFYREARAAGGLAHPGIVPVFDVGEHEELPFLVMEFISGQTLANAAKRGERMSLDRVSEVGQQIAEALGYAHRHGVVHRDIKPANILMTSRELYGIERPKITDFGVAKLAAGQITTSGQMLGTPAFMPPEQFTGNAIDGRADLFSLGVILYWLATGEQAFPGESVTAVSYKVVHTEPVAPKKLNPSIPAKLEGVILRCLEKSPADRYQTGEDLARDLAAVRGGAQTTGAQTRPQQPYPVSGSADVTLDVVPPQQPALPTIVVPPQAISVSTAKQRRGRLALVAGVFAVLVIALAGVSWYALRKTFARPPVASITMPSPPPPVAATPAPAPEPVPAAPKAAVSAAVASSAKRPAKDANHAASAMAATPVPVPPSPKVQPAKVAPVDFDPKTLDPKTNARLRIDAGHMPAGLDFVLEMNGKAYLNSSAEGNKKEYENFYVPPGVQEFRVIAKSGAVQKVSNTVSTDFKAKKRNSLTIELRMQGGAPDSGTPQGLYPDSQIVLTLK